MYEDDVNNVEGKAYDGQFITEVPVPVRIQIQNSYTYFLRRTSIFEINL